jgi:hypothetical protein
MKIKEKLLNDFVPCFRDNLIEKDFQRFNNLQNETLVRFSFIFYSLSQLIFMIAEFNVHNLYQTSYVIIFCRSLIVIILFLSWCFTHERFLLYRREVVLLSYNIIGIILVIMDLIVCLFYKVHDKLDDCPYSFSWGVWSLSDSIFFMVLTFNCSGLLFADISFTAFCHILLILFLPFIVVYDSLPRPTSHIYYLPVLQLLQMLYSHNIELENRYRFSGQIEAERTLAGQDKLINSVLPPAVTHALKTGSNSGLASYYTHVTILFCYIVDFNHHTSSIHPQETVNLCYQIVSVMDRIVERTGAYKVENIAETYMACSGCPEEVICGCVFLMVLDSRTFFDYLSDRTCNDPGGAGNRLFLFFIHDLGKCLEVA